jgi:chemotaxis signal transduction protein
LIGEHRMAIPVPQTEGIVQAVPVRPVPGFRPALRGIIPWHDGVVPVVDLFPGAVATQMIILGTRRGPLAVGATEILGIYPDAAIERQDPIPPSLPRGGDRDQ